MIAIIFHGYINIASLFFSKITMKNFIKKITSITILGLYV